MRLPRGDSEEPQPPTGEHVEAVCRLLPSRYRLPLLVLDATGMRLGELEGLTWGDVDEQRGRWRVSQAVSKTSRARWVQVPPVIFEAVGCCVEVAMSARCPPMGDAAATGARETLEQLTSAIDSHFGSGLLGLYLFGSLAAGAFYPGKSDLDLMAIVAAEVEEGQQLESLRSLHDAFVSERPAWVERVEVAYVDRGVLRTFGDRPSGRIAVINPGEPLHIRDVGFDSTLDWHSVTTQGETILGPPPLELGPTVSPGAYRHAVEALLSEWPSRVRAPWVAYVPAHQGYVVMTLCRALYALATGEQTTKEEAAAWAAARYPEWSSYINEARATYRADVHDQHSALISFTDHAVAEANGLIR